MTPTYHFKYHQISLSACLVFFLLLSACQNKKQKETEVAKSDSISATSSISISKNDLDTLITTPCPVFIYPTVEQIDKMKGSAKDSDDFYTGADDYQYYMGEAGEFLDSIKAKSITRDAKGSIAFKTTGGKTYNILVDTRKWSIILFDAKSKPFNADITSFQDDYKKYMHK